MAALASRNRGGTAAQVGGCPFDRPESVRVKDEKAQPREKNCVRPGRTPAPVRPPPGSWTRGQPGDRTSPRRGPRRRWLPARFPGLSRLIAPSARLPIPLVAPGLIAPSARLPIPLVAPGLSSRVRRIIWRERRLISFGRQHGSPTCRRRPRWRSTEVHGATAGGGRRHREALPGDGDSNIPLIDLASPLPKGLKQVSY